MLHIIAPTCDFECNIVIYLRCFYKLPFVVHLRLLQRLFSTPEFHCPYRDLNRRLVYALHLFEFSLAAKTGQHPSAYFPILKILGIAKIQKSSHLNLILKYFRILDFVHYLFLDAHSFLKLRFGETVSYSEQIMSAREQIYTNIFSSQANTITVFMYTQYLSRWHT